jgi:hypothetical protein
VLKDPEQSEEFRNSPHWDSPLLDFKLRVPEQSSSGGRAARSNSFSGNERNRLVMGGPDGFTGRSLVSGTDCQEDARSFALLDFDQDGWADIALASCNGPRLRLFRNRFGELGGTGRVVEVILRGSHDRSEPSSEASNRDGVGAVLTAVTNQRTRAFRKSVGEGLAAQNSERLRITLAKGERLEKLTVRWPSGKVSNHSPAPDQSRIHLHE